jgi:hypothetical protein
MSRLPRQLAALSLLEVPLIILADVPVISWSTDHLQPHYADVNGDGVSDLLLQANNDASASTLVFGTQQGSETVNLSNNQHPLPRQINGYDWNATQAKLVVADFNGDALADLLAIFPTSGVTVTVFAQKSTRPLTVR